MSAQNSSRQLAFIPEVTYGVTPTGTPQTQLIEFVDFTAELESETLTSNSINASRQVQFARRGNKSAAGDLTVELTPDNFDVFIEAVLGGSWATNVVKNGSTKRSFTFEEGFADIAQYRTFNGMIINSMSMDVTPDGLIQASFGLVGAGSTAFTATSIDSSPTAVTKKPVFYHEGGTFNEGGSAVAYISGISFEITNNAAGNYALGNTSYHNVSMGRIDVTGTVTAYFPDPVLYNKFYNNTASNLSFTLAAGSPSETLTFSFPDVRYTSGSLQRGADGPVTVELGFTAIYDTTAATTMSVTRSA